MSSTIDLTRIKITAWRLSKSVFRNLTLLPHVEGATVKCFSRPPYYRHARCWEIQCIYTKKLQKAIGKLLSMKPEPFLINTELMCWWRSMYLDPWKWMISRGTPDHLSRTVVEKCCPRKQHRKFYLGLKQYNYN